MPTPAQSRAAAAHKLKRKEAGEKQITVWLSADALERLNNLTQFMGTRQMALQWAINRVTCPPDEVAERRALLETTPSKPVSEPEKRPSVVNKADGLGVTVQLGPSRSVPGARQKSPKGKR
jgi:hypothetical protein